MKPLRLPLLASVAIGTALQVPLAACHRSAPTASARLDDLTISGAFAFQPVTADEGAVYFQVSNAGSLADTLVSAASDIAAGSMFHGAAMHALSGLEIPPGGTLTLAPGGTHLMLMTLRRMPRAGERIGLVLRFRRAGSIALQVPVRPYGE